MVKKNRPSLVGVLGQICLICLIKIVKAVEKFRVLLDVIRKKCFPPSMSLLEIVTAHWLSQTVIVATELGIADHLLENGPLEIGVLAQKTQAHEESLYRLLRVLVAVGIFAEPSPRIFAINKMSRPLAQNSPDSIRGFVRMNGRPFHWNAWGALLHSVKTGEASLKTQQGVGLFEYLSKHQEESRIFDEAMTAVATPAARAIAVGMDFSRYSVIADIGGGHGNFLGTVLSRHPDAKGILFDQAHVVSGAKPILEKISVYERCRVVPGSFFDFVPEGADAYILKNIIHDWSDELSIQILSNVRKAMRPEAHLLLVETVIPQGSGYHVGKMIDLEMLVCTPGGKERTQKQLEELFACSGLKLERVHATLALESVVVAKPI
jgi:hypothetical protein